MRHIQGLFFLIRLCLLARKVAFKSWNAFFAIFVWTLKFEKFIFDKILLFETDYLDDKYQTYFLVT